MKKRLLLGLLPVALILSACAGAGSKVDNNLFVEDTLAHEEIFGDVKDFGFAPRRNLTPVDSSELSIGVQYSSVAAGKVSMRFIAAIKVDGSTLEEKKAALAHTTAVWTRTVYDEDGDKLLTEREDDVVSTKAYDSINSGGESLAIGDYGDGSYSFFVAYTMKNIPVATTSYFNISLSVRDSEDATFNKDSKVIAASIDGNTKFSFSSTDTGYFGVKKTGSGFESFEKTGGEGDGNHASFERIPLDKNESFVLVNKESNKFEVFGYNKTHAADNGDNNFDQDGSSAFAKAKLDLLSYSLYLSENVGTENFIYVNRMKTFYLVPNSNWTSDGARFAVNYTFSGNDTQYWYSMYQVGETNLYYCTIPFGSTIGRLIFCRMNGSNPTNSWDYGVKYNQTADMSGTNVVDYNKYTVTDAVWDGSANDAANWSVERPYR